MKTSTSGFPKTGSPRFSVLRLLFAALAGMGVLAGCATTCCVNDTPVDCVPLAGVGVLTGCASKPVAVEPVALGVVPSHQNAVETPTTFLAVGHGSQGNYSQYNVGQRKLMAMRAAQIDAYRSLAEQVHGFRVWGNTAVSDFVTQNDSVRTYVDAFIRGARLVGMVSIGDGNFEATVELSLPPNFAYCVRNVRNVSQCARPATTRVAMPLPVIAPSVVYSSP